MNREGEMKTVEEYQADMGDYASEKATMVLRQALEDLKEECAKRIEGNRRECKSQNFGCHSYDAQEIRSIEIK